MARKKPMKIAMIASRRLRISSTLRHSMAIKSTTPTSRPKSRPYSRRVPAVTPTAIKPMIHHGGVRQARRAIHHRATPDPMHTANTHHGKRGTWGAITKAMAAISQAMLATVRAGA